jgi:DNA topoisomerase-2
MSKNQKISNIKPKKDISGKENRVIEDDNIPVEKQFTKKTHHQHILARPGMYIGPIKSDKTNMYVYSDEVGGIIRKDINVVLGLYKIFDEILVNAADHTTRDKKCNRIDVYVDSQTGTIEVKNNGTSVPVEFHKDEEMYVPELIFGNLLTSGNYDDNEERLVGGCNGLGAKAANIYSDWFDVEIQDTVRHKKYYQRFSNNMYKKEEPVITELSKTCTDSYTKFKFLPDYKKFGLEYLTEDHVALFKRRVYDVAGTTNSNVKVHYNGEYIDIKTFEDYIKLYYTDRDENDIKLIYQDFNERWSVGVVYDPSNEFRHMTFVNKISTYDGGTHLNYIINQIIDKITNSILSQSKYKSLKIRPAQVKDNLTVFINTSLENPIFGSQTKDALKTKSTDFKIKCEIDDKFIAKICKSGLMDEIVQLAQFKQLSELDKSAKKVTNLKKIVKLEDARFANSKQGYKCTLILTEGDSAKKFAIDGFDVVGRDYFGVFPLKGKLLNVREATVQQLLNNEEIINLMQILGLDRKKTYKSTKGMRYGHILLLTDQDLDGSHIKGLIMNFIHTFWPSLAKINGFIQSIATPIVKVFKKNDTKRVALHTFYTMSEYKKWCDKTEDMKNYDTKYYKGLATSSEQEAIEAFTDYDNKIINYLWNKKIEEQEDNPEQEDNQEQEDNLEANQKNIDASDATSTVTDSNDVDKNDPSYKAITLAFAKNRANDRKVWLGNYDPEQIIDNSNKNVTIDEFVECDLKHFSISDNKRSIPDGIDGLKPSQRKIVFGAFKRKLENVEIKVAQLSGYISEHTGYHHGEASLQGAIINMAQNFCGSNNINIFEPNGNFGSRRVGGEDAGSARYIFTKLSKLAKLIYNSKDSPILESNDEEGEIVEPKKYLPIIPMILVNGCKGIGTGYSTFVPQYNPLDLIKNIRDYLNGKPFEKLDELIPWYRGFTGKIEKKQKVKPRDKETYDVSGVAVVINENTIRVKELPVGVWTEDYLKFLEIQREDGTFIVDYVNNSSNHKIDILITFANGQLQYLIKNNLIDTRLKLKSSISIENMHLYKDNVIVKYKSANAILKDYIKIRLDAYELRKKYGIKILENEMLVLKYRKQYIQDILEKRIIIERVTKSKLTEQIVNMEYPMLSINLNSNPSYDYLFSLPLTSLTTEKIDDLHAEYNEKNNELELYKNCSIYDLWLTELDEFEQAYNKWLTETDYETNGKKSNSKSKTNAKSQDKPNAKSNPKTQDKSKAKSNDKPKTK